MLAGWRYCLICYQERPSGPGEPVTPLRQCLTSLVVMGFTKSHKTSLRVGRHKSILSDSCLNPFVHQWTVWSAGCFGSASQIPLRISFAVLLKSFLSRFWRAAFDSLLHLQADNRDLSGYIFALCLPTLFRSRGLSTSAGMNWA